MTPPTGARRARWLGPRLLLGAAWMAFTPLAAAQWLGHDYAVYGAPLSNYVTLSALHQSHLNRLSAGGGQARAEAPGAQPAAPSTLAPAAERSAASASELAALLPAERRGQMLQIYQQCLVAYRQLEAKLGTPANDVAGAVAAFLAGNYMGLRGVDVPDEHFRRLVAQTREALRQSPSFAKASPAEKRQLYEQMAMVGTFMALARTSFQQQPNPGAEKHFRDAAAANLQAALKVPAEQVRITEQGLTLR